MEFLFVLYKKHFAGNSNGDSLLAIRDSLLGASELVQIDTLLLIISIKNEPKNKTNKWCRDEKYTHCVKPTVEE